MSYPQTIQVVFAAAPVANSPYKLSNTSTGDVPTATICGAGDRVDIVVGAADTYYNSTLGKLPTAPWSAGDVFTVELQTGIVNLRAASAFTEGVQLATHASGQVDALNGEDYILGVSLGAASAQNDVVSVLFAQTANPAAFADPA